MGGVLKFYCYSFKITHLKLKSDICFPSFLDSDFPESLLPLDVVFEELSFLFFRLLDLVSFGIAFLSTFRESSESLETFLEDLPLD